MLEFPATLEALPAMLGYIDAAARAGGLSDALCRRLELASEEALVNVVSYAFSNEQPAKLLSIHCEKQGSVFCAQFIDNGKPFDPVNIEMKIDITKPIDQREVGGLGIFLMHKLIDEVIYEREGDQNKLTFKLKM